MADWKLPSLAGNLNFRLNCLGFFFFLSFLFSFAFSSCHGGYAYIFFICICFCVCDRFRFTRPWATTFRLRGLCMLGTCLSVAGPRKFASSASVRIFIVRTWWMCVRAQTGPRFIALIRRSLGSGVCTTVNSKWLSHFLTQRPKLGSNPWPLDYQSGALTNWAIVPPPVNCLCDKFGEARNVIF